MDEKINFMAGRKLIFDLKVNRFFHHREKNYLKCANHLHNNYNYILLYLCKITVNCYVV